MARNWRTAVVFSIASAAKLVRSGLRLVEQRADADQRGLAGEIEPVFGIDPAADGIVQLRGIHAEMDAAHAQPVGAHRGGEHQQLARGLVGGICAAFSSCGDDRRERHQPRRIVRGQPVGRIRQRVGIAEIAGEQRLHFGGMRLGGAQRRKRGRPGRSPPAARHSAPAAAPFP